MKDTGRTELYSQIKKQYRYEKYLDLKLDPFLKRNITAIRTSCHCLPIEYLRRKGIERKMRHCNLCQGNEIGTEMHVLTQCRNVEVSRLKCEFLQICIKLNSQYQNFRMEDFMKLQLLGNDTTTGYYFAVFLKKLFHLVQSSY